MGRKRDSEGSGKYHKTDDFFPLFTLMRRFAPQVLIPTRVVAVAAVAAHHKSLPLRVTRWSITIPDPTLRQIGLAPVLHKIAAVRTRPALTGLVPDPVIQANLVPVPVLVLSHRPVLKGPVQTHPDPVRDPEAQPGHNTPKDLVRDRKHRRLAVPNHVPAVDLRRTDLKAEVPLDPEVDRDLGQVLR